MDGTESSKDALPMGQPSEGGKETPPAKTYTEAELQKAISDLKSLHGRDRKELATNLKEAQATRDALEKSANATSTRLQALEERIAEKELEGARDNPSLLKLYQDRQALTRQQQEVEKKERDLGLREARIAAVEAEVQETKKDTLLSVIATKVSAAQLERFKGLNLEALEAVTDAFGKAPAPPGAPEFTPDSGLPSPGVGAITPEWAETATPEEYAERRKKLSPEKFKP